MPVLVLLSQTLVDWSAVQSGVSGSNSSCVAIDMLFSNGSESRYLAKEHPMRGKWQEYKHALGKLLVCAGLLVVSLLSCQQGMATVPLETAPCAAAQLQVHVTGLAGPLASSEVATLYLGGGTWLYALDAGSGFPPWCRVLQWKGPSQQNPLMGFGASRHVGQELFADIQYGYLLGLDAQNGAVRWGVEVEAGQEFWMELAVDEGAGQVYGVGLSEAKALKLSDGQERWSYRLPQK
jgi:hypothetical protein